jgi:hypothetical protein
VHKSSTVYFYDDGLLLKMTGCRAKISFQFNVAQAPMMTVEFAGHFVSVTDVALADADVHPSSRFRSSTFRSPSAPTPQSSASWTSTSAMSW